MGLVVNNNQTSITGAYCNGKKLIQIFANTVPVWVSPLTPTGTIYCVSETYKKYHNYNNGYVRIDVTNVTNDFIKLGSYYKVKFYVSGFATVTRWLSANYYRQDFTGIAGPTTKTVTLIDMYAEDYGLSRRKSYSVKVGFNDATRTYSL